jgi:5,10-methylenetetrahydrofolate reductase
MNAIKPTATKEVRPVSFEVSFEFFPPADAEMEATLWKSIERLAPLAPHFVSVTYGADGSTRERTHNVVTRIQSETSLIGAPHLTCIGASRGEILDIATGIRASVTWSHYGVIRRKARLNTYRTRTALRMPPTWLQD